METTALGAALFAGIGAAGIADAEEAAARGRRPSGWSPARRAQPRAAYARWLDAVARVRPGGERRCPPTADRRSDQAEPVIIIAQVAAVQHDADLAADLAAGREAAVDAEIGLAGAEASHDRRRRCRRSRRDW